MNEYYHFYSFLHFGGAKVSQRGGFLHGYRLRVFNGTTVWLHDNKGKGGVSVDRNYFPFNGMRILIKRVFLFVPGSDVRAGRCFRGYA